MQVKQELEHVRGLLMEAEAGLAQQGQSLEQLNWAVQQDRAMTEKEVQRWSEYKEREVQRWHKNASAAIALAGSAVGDTPKFGIDSISAYFDTIRDVEFEGIATPLIKRPNHGPNPAPDPGPDFNRDHNPSLWRVFNRVSPHGNV